ncbi:MAG: TonB-dependent receptor, partial [Cyclobacteriaceae bacterium]|nr:TonB-dependent receptor [Cyclobacteriaceae bacterium]
MKKTLQLLIVLLGLTSSVIAQTKISGTVTDTSGEILIGANVFIKDSYDGTSTDVNGQYSFSTSQKGEAVLVVSFIGYVEQNQTVDLTGKPVSINFVLKEAINKMDAVVISAGSFDAGTGTKSEVLKPLDIVTTAGATADIAGALNSLPGTQTVGEEGRLFVRGGDGSETKTFIDGLQVLKPYTTTIPNTPTRGRFSPFMFSGTSFSTGGYSAEYGQALSSALILNTKDKPTQTRTDLSLMSVGAELSHTHSWATSSLAVQGAYYNLAPYFGLVPQTNDWIHAPESAQGNLAARKEVGSNGMWKAYGNVYTGRFSFYEHDILDPSQKSKIDIFNQYAYGNTSLKNTLGNSWSYHTGLAFTTNTDNITMDNETIKETTRGGHAKFTLSGDAYDWLTINTGAELLYSESSQEYTRNSD